MTDFKNAAETLYISPKKRGGKNKVFLIVSGGILLAALAVCAVLLLSTGQGGGDSQRVAELGTVMQGVSVGGIDISGMTRDQALAATANLPTQMLSKVNFTVEINGVDKSFTAQDFALTTDYNAVIDKAIAYGRTGTFDERLTAANKAKESPVDFPVTVSVDETALKTALTTLKSQMDTAPADATVTFAPWGYTETKNADGSVTDTPWTPTLDEIKAICDTYAKGKEYTSAPNLVRLADDQKPNALRYLYYKNTGYVDDYIPREWNIAHFIYTPEVDGLVVDADTIFNAVVQQVKSGTYETIVAPTTVTPATVKLADIKNKTQLIASWTSSFGGSSHYKYPRNYNVSMMSSLLNGAVIAPGAEWSVNDTAGLRNATTAKTYGWQKAAGIENGGYSPQYGGGVCQLGSTVYNAAIRSGLTITEHWHHSIPSDYVPIGLDATLDSGGKDLKLKNDTQNTFYLVSYINPTDRNVTVEMYGVPLTDSTGQQIILNYSSKNTGRYGTPVASVVPVPEGFVCPDETVISANPAIGLTSYGYADNRQGTTAQSYVTTYALDGTKIGDTKPYDSWKYPIINGTTYVLNSSVTVTPTPGVSESAAPTETSPAESTSTTP